MEAAAVGGGAPALLPRELLAALPPEAVAPIEALLEAQLERHYAARAIFEASRKRAEESLQSTEEEKARMNEELEEYRVKLKDAETRAIEAENQMEFSRAQLRDAQEALAVQKSSCENFSLQKESTLEVHRTLSNMIESRDNEIECLKRTIENLQSQLKNAIEIRCETLTKNSRMEDSTSSDKNRRMPNERVEILTAELRRCTNDLHAVKASMTTTKVNFERQLAKKISELNVANAKTEKLNRTIDSLNDKIESLDRSLAEQREAETKLRENHRDELLTNMKVAELYKSAQEDSNKKNDELSKTIAELTQLQNDSMQECDELKHRLGSLEAEYKRIVEEKNESIVILKRELENANDLLQMTDADFMNSTMDDISPSAAIASKLIRSKMSITQAYDQLLKLTEDLNIEKNENKRLSHALASIIAELEEKSTLIERQRRDYEESLEKNEFYTQQLESVIVELNGLKEEKSEIEKHFKVMQKDNSKLKEEIVDLSNQICFLLRESSQNRGIFRNAESNDSRLVNGPQDFVTFRDINELQANNQKLLRLVRELSEKKEENEQSRGNVPNEEMEEKLRTLEDRVGELTSAQDRQIKMMNALVEQRDKYMKLYNDHVRQSSSRNNSFSMESSMRSFDSNNFNNSSNALVLDTKKIKYIDLLESQIRDLKSDLDNERDDHKVYAEQMKKNEIKLLECNEAISKQLNELHKKYSKCSASSENANARIKVLQAEIATYRKEIFSLNQKIGNYTSLIGKQEFSIKKHLDDLSNSRNKLTNAESSLRNLQAECRTLKDTTKVTSVADELRGICTSALKSIEIVQSTLSDESNESGIQLQLSLEEANRTCTSLRCILQEESEKHQNITLQLYQEIEELKKSVENEKSIAGGLQKEISDLHKELESKKTFIDDFSKKTSFGHFASEVHTNLEIADKSQGNQLEDFKRQIVTLQQQLEISKKHIEKYSNIYESSENELKAVHFSFNQYKSEMEEKFERVTQSERIAKAKCIDLEKELSTRSDQLNMAENRVNSLSLELTDKNNNLEKAMIDIAKLSENVKLAEEKYAHEIILHSNDIQALTHLENQVSIANENLNKIKQEKIELEHALRESKVTWDKHQMTLTVENEDIKKQIVDLNHQNSMLHDQIQALSKTMSSISGSSSKNSETANSEAPLNTSVSDDEIKSSEQLLNIIKYLRKEKEVSLAQFEILQAENVRIKSQLEAAEALLDETKLTLNQSDTVQVSTKHSGVLRKIEELSAISDCYVNLRRERDELLKRISEISESYKSLQDSVAPAQSSIGELTSKVELFQSENDSLKDEVKLWKDRVNSLIERNHDDFPNDWKKIQAEHETFGKLLVIEKENYKRVSEEAEKLKCDNATLEKQVETLKKQNNMISDNLRKHMSELNNCKKELEKINVELNQAKATVNEKTNANVSVSEMLASKEALLNESRTKEMQIRKIAKNYKMQYQELVKTTEEEKKKVESLTSDAAKAVETHTEERKEFEKKMTELEKKHSEKLTELNNQISAYSNENKQLQKDIEALKATNQELDERAKVALKQAIAKIALLKESKETLTKELKASKDRVDHFEQNKDENDVRLQVIKSQYDGRVSKIEKEKAQLLQDRQNEINQLSRQVETLQKRLDNQQQQIAKPSTSSNSGEKQAPDPPTANIKPMAGVASPRDVNRRQAGETPLASIRPMASHSGIRTAAVLPTSAQLIHHQTPHTTGNSSADSIMSSSSGGAAIHTAEFMPSSSSVASRVSHLSHSRVTPLPPPESTQDIEGESVADTEMSSAASTPSAPTLSVNALQHGPQQGVALVMPRMETSSEPQTSQTYQQQASSSSNTSSSTVTSAGKVEIQRAFKRPRITSAPPQKTILKRSKTQMVESDIEYQMPTSSQRDQEDDVNFSDIGDEDANRIYRIEDDEDGERQQEVERLREEAAEPEHRENVGNNDSNSNPSENMRADNAGGDRPDTLPIITIAAPLAGLLPEQQIETISSGNGMDGGFLMIGGASVSGVASAVTSGAYEDGDDSIVPSTPTLYVPARNDGFGEAVRSPMTSRATISTEGRFTFNESNATGGVMEDTHADLAQLTTQNRSSSDDVASAVSPDDNVAILVTSGAEVEAVTANSSTVDNEASTVTSPNANSPAQQPQVEEGSEAEASTSGANNSNNTPIRAPFQGGRGRFATRRPGTPHVHTPRPMGHQRPSPIVWSEGNMRRGNQQQRGQPRGGGGRARRPGPYFRHF